MTSAAVYHPVPYTPSVRDADAIARVRVALQAQPEAVVLSVPTDVLRVLLAAVDALEADRDAEAQAAVVQRGRGRTAEQLVGHVLEQTESIVCWAARQLGVPPRRSDVIAAIRAEGCVVRPRALPLPARDALFNATLHARLAEISDAAVIALTQRAITETVGDRRRALEAALLIPRAGVARGPG